TTWNQVNNVAQTEVELGTGAPTSTPTGTDPVIYVDTASGDVYSWDGTTWNLISVDTVGVETGSGAPTSTPTGGQPVVYVDLTNGDIYTWDGSAWS
ncbi:MAG: hypothetical protein AAF499_18325, partial [Pseudomonadota bacterium]